MVVKILRYDFSNFWWDFEVRLSLVEYVNYSIITSYKSVFIIIVLVPNLDVVATVNSVVTGALNGIILTYYSSLV